MHHCTIKFIPGQWSPNKQHGPHAFIPPVTTAGWVSKHLVGQSPKLNFQNTRMPGYSSSHFNSHTNCSDFEVFEKFDICLKHELPWGGDLHLFGDRNHFPSDWRRQPLSSTCAWVFMIVLSIRCIITLVAAVWLFSTVWPIVGCSCCWIKYVQFSTNYGNLPSHFGKCQQGYSLT